MRRRLAAVSLLTRDSEREAMLGLSLSCGLRTTRRSDGGVLCEVQDEARDEGCQAGEDEERPIGHERTLPHVRHRALPHHGFVRPASASRARVTSLFLTFANDHRDR